MYKQEVSQSRILESWYTQKSYDIPVLILGYNYES